MEFRHLPNSTVMCYVISFFLSFTKIYFMGYVALFHVPVTEMHLHKVLMCFEGRGGVVN